jgi:hypothetical protein
LYRERTLQVAHDVDRPAGLDVLPAGRPWGDVHCQSAELGRAVKGWPRGPSAASRAAASLTARNRAATREIASDQASMERGSSARAPCTIRACRLKRRERLPRLSSHPVPLARKPKPDHIDAERARFRRSRQQAQAVFHFQGCGTLLGPTREKNQLSAQRGALVDSRSTVDAGRRVL